MNTAIKAVRAIRQAVVASVMLAAVGAPALAQVRSVGAGEPPPPVAQAPAQKGGKKVGGGVRVQGFAPLSARTSDEVIARDVATFAERIAAARQAGESRRVGYLELARDAYERNDPGAVLAAMLSAADGAQLPRTRRPELWALVDSTQQGNAASVSRRDAALALEFALVRSQYETLGAPNCGLWESRAVELASVLRALRTP